MLAMADQHGRVWASIPGLANRARVPLEDTQAALNAFLSPDPYSRTPDHEGRRIESIDGGWRLLNHEKYRAIRDEESVKESKRNYINARRAAERAAAVEQSRTVSNSVDSGRANTEAEAEAEAKNKNNTRPDKSGSRVAKTKAVLTAKDLQAQGIDPQHAADWLILRKAKRLPLTPTAWDDTVAEGQKAGLSPAQTVAKAVANNWAGFKASWPDPGGHAIRSGPAAPVNRQQAIEERNRAVGLAWLASMEAQDGP